MYHSKLGEENIEKLIEAGRRFWVEDPRRFEALAKQKRREKKKKKEWWASMSEEEKQKWIADNAWTSTDEGRKIISQKLKEVWKNYSKEEKEARKAALDAKVKVAEESKKNKVKSEAKTEDIADKGAEETK